MKRNILMICFFFCAASISAQVARSANRYEVKMGLSSVKYAISNAISSSGSTPVDTILKGSLTVDGIEYMIYLEDKRPYSLAPLYKNGKRMKIAPSSIWVDFNNDNVIGVEDGEVWGADLPVRFGNQMLKVRSIAADGKTIILEAVEVPLTGLVPGQPAPDFEFTDLDGKKHRLRDYRGKYLVLDSWSIYCSACIKDMHKTLELQNQLGKDKLSVILLSMDNKGRQDPKYKSLEASNKVKCKELGMPWPNVFLPGSFEKLREKFNYDTFGSILIGPDGKVVFPGYAHTGSLKRYFESQGVIAQALEGANKD